MQQELARAARKAIDELNLPCEVVTIVEAPGRAGWSIQFTTGYGQLISTFHDEMGQKYSHARIVEIIKHHLSVKEEMRARPSER
ncbi:MAG: hypothetical protein QOC96_463 [Acidobacteriota bacterium]|jgi:hypothetical protein|nr:hypothetical protein [Acidobacteriota bacterium]